MPNKEEVKIDVFYTDDVIGPNGVPGGWMIQVTIGPHVLREMRAFALEEHAREHAASLFERLYPERH